MIIQVPKKRLAGFRQLKDYPQEDINKVFHALKGARPASTITDLAAQVALATGQNAEGLKQLFSAVAGLYLTLESKEVTIDTIVNDVTESLEAIGTSDFTFDQPSRQSFQDRLREILSFSAVLGLTAKALDLFLQQETVFCKARIFTDIRPVFPISAEDNPSDVILVHTLKIRYHQNGEQQPSEFFVAMNEDDVETLISVLERARRKHAALKQLLQDGKLGIIEGGHGCAR